MSLFQTIRREAFTLAMVMGSDDVVARQQLEAYLASSGLAVSKRYFSQISVTKRDIRSVGYMHYAEVPMGTKAPSPVKIVPVPACLVATFTIPVSEMDRLADGAYNEPFKDYLNAQGVRMELFPLVLASINEVDQTIQVQIPYKKQ